MSRALDNFHFYQKAIAKGHLGSCGVEYKDLSKPIIGVVNSWNEIVPGHCHLRDLAEEVKRGVREAGGLPLEFNVIAICDGIAQGHRGMKYVLPSRDLIADSAEAMVEGHGIFDGLVFLGSCDKIVPGLLMAAGRLNLPAIIVTGGPMENKIKPWESKRARQSFIRGEISEEELFKVTQEYYPSPGVCPFLGTANTMCIMAEVLGMSLPGSALVPSMSEERRTIAFKSGEAVMSLLNQNIRPRDIMTQAAFHNAITTVSAVGASLNTVLHLPAIAHECGVNIGYEDFDAASKNTPLIVRVAPNNQDYTLADLEKVGGIPAVLKELLPLLKPEALTVSTRPLGIEVADAPNPDGKILKPLSSPFEAEGGIAILRGNIAPLGAVVKSAAVPTELWHFHGPAKVFDSQEDCLAGLEAGRIQQGDAVIIRYEGPIGGPGMREMHRISEIAAKVPGIALITDGRFSGASIGLSVGYLSPEAAEGGPLALIQEGDIIEINIPERSINWLIDQDEEVKRRSNLPNKHVTKDKSAFLRLYGKSATSAALGAIRKV